MAALLSPGCVRAMWPTGSANCATAGESSACLTWKLFSGSGFAGGPGGIQSCIAARIAALVPGVNQSSTAR